MHLSPLAALRRDREKKVTYHLHLILTYKFYIEISKLSVSKQTVLIKFLRAKINKKIS